ncbi:hypothetical protein MD484_g5417, partial [Candolleomyces efflorescens]
MAFWFTKIPLLFLFLLTSTFLSLPVPAFSLRVIVPKTSNVNARTPMIWVPEPSDGLGQDNSLPPTSDETSLFDLRFVNADTQEDEGLAKANVDYRLALANGGRQNDEVVFNRPGRFFLRAVSGPTFRTIGTSDVVTVAAASTTKLVATPTSSGTSGPSSSTSSTTPSTASQTSNKTPIIVGALIGALVFIALLALLLLFLLRRRRIQREEEEAISRLSFHPDQMVIPKSAVTAPLSGVGSGTRRQSLAARFWGSFSGSGHGSSAPATVNAHQTILEDRDLENGLAFGGAVGAGDGLKKKEEEARRPSDTTSLSSKYSGTSSTSTLSPETDPHADIHSHPCPPTFPEPPPQLASSHTTEDRELYRARERDIEAARTTSEQAKNRDLEAARESVNSVEDLQSPRVLDRSSTSGSSGFVGTNDSTGTGSSVLLGVMTAFRNPFLDPQMVEVKKPGSSPSIFVPPAPLTQPPPVPPLVRTTPASIRELPSLPTTPNPAPILVVPAPVEVVAPVPRAQRSVRIAEVVEVDGSGRVGSESPRLPPVRISQNGLGLVFSVTSPNAPPTSSSAAGNSTTTTASTTATTTTPLVKKSVTVLPPPPPSKKRKVKQIPQPKPVTSENRPSTPTTRARPLPTPTLPLTSAAAATYAKPLPAPVPSRPTTPNTGRPLPTPGLAVNVPLPRTPSPPTPGASASTSGFRALPPVPPYSEGGLRSAPIAPPTSAFTARLEPPVQGATSANTESSSGEKRTKRQRYLDLRLSQAQSQLGSLNTKMRRGEIEEGVARRVVRDLEKQVEWLDGGIREGGWAKGERDWMEEGEEAGWRRWMRPREYIPPFSE